MEAMRDKLATPPAMPQPSLSEAETARLLDTVESAHGSYGQIDPAQLAESRMPAPMLRERLLRIRQLAFARISPQGAG